MLLCRFSCVFPSIHKPAPHTTPPVAFIGFNPDGTVVNQWDAPDKNFSLTSSEVASLRASGRTVLVSMGGADGGVWPDTAPPSFVSNMVEGINGAMKKLGLDGIDFDIERCV